MQFLLLHWSPVVLSSSFQVCVLDWCRPKLDWCLCCPNIRSVWARRLPSLWWWTQSQSYCVLGVGCGWKLEAEVFTELWKCFHALCGRYIICVYRKLLYCSKCLLAYVFEDLNVTVDERVTLLVHLNSVYLRCTEMCEGHIVWWAVCSY